MNELDYRYHRTLQEAFGPYTDDLIHQPEEYSDALIVGFVAAYFLAGIAIALVFLGVI